MNDVDCEMEVEITGKQVRRDNKKIIIYIRQE
jgi:hypothetical protein